MLLAFFLLFNFFIFPIFLTLGQPVAEGTMFWVCVTVRPSIHPDLVNAIP